MTATVPPASAADEERAGHRQGFFAHGKLHRPLYNPLLVNRSLRDG